MASADAALDPAQGKRFRWMVLALALGTFGIGTGEFAIMGLMSRMAADLGVSPAAVGLAISSYALGVVVGAPLIATLGARVPRRALLIGMMLVFAVGNLGSALAPGYWWLVGLRFLAGLPHGAFIGVAALVAAAHAPPGHRGRAVGAVVTGLTLAIVAGAPLSTWLGQLLGWPVAFLAVGAIALASALLIRLFVADTPPDREASPLTELSAMLNQRVLMTLAVASVGFGGVFAVFSYVVPTLTHQAGMAESLGPFVLAIFGVGTVVGNLVGARLADWNVERAIPLILLWSIAVQGGFYFAANDVVWGFAFVGLVGTGIALGTAMQARLMDVAGDAQTMAASMNHAAFNLANALGAWLAGVTVELGFAWSTTGLVGALLALCGLGLFMLTRRLEAAPHTAVAECS